VALRRAALEVLVNAVERVAARLAVAQQHGALERARAHAAVLGVRETRSRHHSALRATIPGYSRRTRS
jgi:hypothetical protein